MIPLVQSELDEFKDTVWNTHRIRCQKETLLPDGVPDHLYNFPEKYGLENCGKHEVPFHFSMYYMTKRMKSIQ